MNKPASRIPAFVTMTAAILLSIVVVFISISAQTSQSTDAIAASQNIFSWFMTAAGTIALLVGIIYGFVKKQKYANLETERNELKSLAESREERIKELIYTASESKAKLELKIANKETDITNLKESNSALVSVSLQMKGILRKLRLDGIWHGHEEEIHETQQ
ncbi:MAG TPA: hypothetical protein VK612_12935 [Pyrinomonadaceae bacterium]|nr:hypothetical protein [Pyrinomonadaceae bacterium]